MIIHFRRPHANDPIWGLGELESGESLYSDFINRTLYNTRFMANGAMPSSVLVNEGYDGSQEDWEKLQRAFEEKDGHLWDNLPEWMQKSWEKAAPTNPRVRYMDTNLVMCRDLYDLHGLAFLITAKDDLGAQVNNLRVLIRSDEVLMHPRCVHTDRHWRTTTWQNHPRNEFARRASEHGDLLACGIYGARNLDKQRNPFPPGWGLGSDVRDRRPAPLNAAQRWAKALKA